MLWPRLGLSALNLLGRFSILDHTYSKKVYVYVEQVWPDLEGLQTDRQTDRQT